MTPDIQKTDWQRAADIAAHIMHGLERGMFETTNWRNWYKSMGNLYVQFAIKHSFTDTAVSSRIVYNLKERMFDDMEIEVTFQRASCRIKYAYAPPDLVALVPRDILAECVSAAITLDPKAESDELPF